MSYLPLVLTGAGTTLLLYGIIGACGVFDNIVRRWRGEPPMRCPPPRTGSQSTGTMLLLGAIGFAIVRVATEWWL